MERHERLSAQVGLLGHPPSENISGGTVRELACMYEWMEEVLEGDLQDEVKRTKKPGVQDSGVY